MDFSVWKTNQLPSLKMISGQKMRKFSFLHTVVWGASRWVFCMSTCATSWHSYAILSQTPFPHPEWGNFWTTFFDCLSLFPSGLIRPRYLCGGVSISIGPTLCMVHPSLTQKKVSRVAALFITVLSCVFTAPIVVGGILAVQPYFIMAILLALTEGAVSG